MSSPRYRMFLSAVVLTSAAACAPDRPSRLDVTRPWDHSRCAAQVEATLAEWGAGPEYLGAPPDRTGAATVRLPTNEQGRWAVVVVREHDGEPTVDLVSDETVVRRRFDTECSVEERTSVAAAAEQDTFGGDDLSSALEAAGRGLVVYAWSPHMPLSVDGWVEIEASASAAGLDVIPVRFQGGDVDFARREAERVGMPPSGLREIASVELIMRDLQVHAPSILVFTPERVSPVLPGYRNAEGYGRFLQNFLGGY